MATEIERKFLLKAGTDPTHGLTGERLCQGYIAASEQSAVRVRRAGDRAWLTIKGAGDGISRPEFEYPIPLADAERLLNELCPPPLIDKTRYRIEHAGHIWEVDVFHGANLGLVLAEVELDSADELLDLPDWVGSEVSHDARYYNSALARTPYSTWSDGDRR